MSKKKKRKCKQIRHKKKPKPWLNPELKEVAVWCRGERHVRKNNIKARQRSLFDSEDDEDSFLSSFLHTTTFIFHPFLSYFPIPSYS
jgi:hypothetical protein